MRRLLPLLFALAIPAAADPILTGFQPAPLFQPQGGIVSVNLGNGLVWSGPEMTPEEWDGLMAGLPIAPPLIPFDAPPIEPGLLSLQRSVPPISQVPEPATLTLVAAGLIAAGLFRRRRATLKAWGTRDSASMGS